MKATFLDDKGAVAADGDGLLRHRRHAHRRRRDRAGPRRARHRVPARRSRPSRPAWCRSAYHKSAAVRAAAEKLYAELRAAGVDVLLDDRDERPGVLFADMDLIGIPHRWCSSERGLAAGDASSTRARTAAQPRGRAARRRGAVPQGAARRGMRRRRRARRALASCCCALQRAGRRAALRAACRPERAAAPLERADRRPRGAELQFHDREDGAPVDLRDVEPPAGAHRPTASSASSCCAPCTTRRTRAGLDPQLVLGADRGGERASASTRCRSAGARGYMQVMPFWIKQIVGSPGTTCSTCAPTCATAA